MSRVLTAQLYRKAALKLAQDFGEDIFLQPAPSPPARPKARMRQDETLDALSPRLTPFFLFGLVRTATAMFPDLVKVKVHAIRDLGWKMKPHCFSGPLPPQPSPKALDVINRSVTVRLYSRRPQLRFPASRTTTCTNQIVETHFPILTIPCSTANCSFKHAEIPTPPKVLAMTRALLRPLTKYTVFTSMLIEACVTVLVMTTLAAFHILDGIKHSSFFRPYLFFNTPRSKNSLVPGRIVPVRECEWLKA
ncbi:hypothetical protein NM688_g4500 [Phlebia brevispora]|uniref:Uncharacterized protein n=1 Tax=Phlebia brevispora TaxID=194682 RepID=A0ACC1T2X5_9APHY|nr:hypothetical protein NM688_g4500 [Phlebia brevispora]